jgi:rhamnosyltransferase
MTACFRRCATELPVEGRHAILPSARIRRKSSPDPAAGAQVETITCDWMIYRRGPELSKTANESEATSHMLASVVIRTFNESKHLGELLTAIESQVLQQCEREVIVVDSGSDDDTVAIAQGFGCRIARICPEEFSFGRSLNMGCELAQGQVLVFVSGHCVPTSNTWLAELINPIIDERCDYTYGRQIGRDTTKYSEQRVFLKYFPDGSLLPQRGYFVNNANAAIRRDTWETYRFNESLTGLEDMELARRLVRGDGRVGYIAEASVYHIHDESWAKVRHRYEREAIALREIIPEVHMTFFDFIRCTFTAFCRDTLAASREGRLLPEIPAIILFRTNQYLGSYRGSRLARKLARMHTRAYFYPHHHYERVKHANYEGYRSLTNEGTQQSCAGKELQNTAGKTTVSMDSR